ncbi:MAG: DegT/DnrJ/EryC1/StrS aminotransferase family protein [Armatimonadota bacterium]
MIPVFRPSYDEKELKALKEVLESRWVGLGPRTKLFEEKFAEYTGVKFASGVNSATSALHLALAGLNIGPGDEVIVPVITFVSTAMVCDYQGAKIVFADVDSCSLNIDLNDVEKKITKRTKAVVPVHFGGYPVDMARLKKIIGKRNIAVIEDCAHAAGSSYKGRKVGSIGDMGCFSFHAVKNLAISDGGMITTNSKKLYDRITKLRWMGISKDTFKRTSSRYSWYYEINEIGYKYHMNDIMAAIGIPQLEKLDKANGRRRRIVDTYNKNFKNIKGIKTPAKPLPGCVSACHNYVVQIDSRDDFVEFMAGRGIAVGVHYMPLNMHPVYKKNKSKTPVASKIWRKLATLPLYPDMTDKDINTVISAVKEFLSKKRG